MATRGGPWRERRLNFDGKSDNRRRVPACRTRPSGADWPGRMVAGAMSMATDEYVGLVASGYRNCGARRRAGGVRCGWRARASRVGGDLRTARPRHGACQTGCAGFNGSRRTRRTCPRQIGYVENDRCKSVAGRASVNQQLFGGSCFAAHRHGARPAAMGGPKYRGDGAGIPSDPWRTCRARRRSESGSWCITGRFLERAVDGCGIRSRCYIRRKLSRDSFPHYSHFLFRDDCHLLARPKFFRNVQQPKPPLSPPIAVLMVALTSANRDTSTRSAMARALKGACVSPENCGRLHGWSRLGDPEAAIGCDRLICRSTRDLNIHAHRRRGNAANPRSANARTVSERDRRAKYCANSSSRCLTRRWARSPSTPATGSGWTASTVRLDESR